MYIYKSSKTFHKKKHIKNLFCRDRVREIRQKEILSHSLYSLKAVAPS